jgi:hypothetical protein
MMQATTSRTADRDSTGCPCALLCTDVDEPPLPPPPPPHGYPAPPRPPPLTMRLAYCWPNYPKTSPVAAVMMHCKAVKLPRIRPQPKNMRGAHLHCHMQLYTHRCACRLHAAASCWRTKDSLTCRKRHPHPTHRDVTGDHTSRPVRPMLPTPPTQRCVQGRPHEGQMLHHYWLPHRAQIAP